ncbi:MAG TPA: glycosyltransferase family 39 protein, partial [Geobacteraceae bacterium]|nr:glycosyltransferase family 39 protein [Geobacteraceae bacterium]
FMYCLARRLFGRETAILAAAVHAYLTASQAVLGVFTHATHFVMLFVLAGLVLLFKGVEENRRHLFFASGLALGSALLMKQHGLFFCIFSLCFLVWKRHTKALGRQVILADVASMMGGMLVPYLATCIYMLVNGVFAEFWFWTVEYSLNYAGTTTLAQGLQNLQHKFEPQYLNLKYAWLLGLFGLLATCRRRAVVRERLFLAGFFLSALLATTPGNLYYRHYFVLVIPPLALLTGAAFEELNHGASRFIPAGMARLVAVGVISLVFATCIYRERDYLFNLSPKDVSRKLYGNDLFVVSDEIARYIRENSDSRAKVAIVGSEPQIYFNAQRTAATDYLYMYSLDRPHEFLTAMQDEMIVEIEKTAPEYIVYVGAYDSWASGLAGDRIMNWANNYLLYYSQVGFIDLGIRRDSICTWGTEAESRLPSLDQYVTVFRRNT